MQTAYMLGGFISLIECTDFRHQKSWLNENLKTQGDSPVISTTDLAPSRPEVIVEFLFDRAALYISVNNIGNRPAISISVKFDKKILGLGGMREISAQAVFKNIEFLGPQRDHATDSSSSYFKGAADEDIRLDQLSGPRKASI